MLSNSMLMLQAYPLRRTTQPGWDGRAAIDASGSSVTNELSLPQLHRQFVPVAEDGHNARIDRVDQALVADGTLFVGENNAPGRPLSRSMQ